MKICLAVLCIWVITCGILLLPSSAHAQDTINVKSLISTAKLAPVLSGNGMCIDLRDLRGKRVNWSSVPGQAQKIPCCYPPGSGCDSFKLYSFRGVRPGKYLLCSELRDSLYNATDGKSGKRTLLGYYVNTSRGLGHTTNYRKATPIVVGGKPKEYNLTIRIQ